MHKIQKRPMVVDEEVIELETDKVNQVLYAPAAGQINFTVGVDDTVAIGDVIGYVDTEAAGAAAAAPAEAPAAAKEAAPAAVSAPEEAPAPAPAVAAAAGGATRVTKESFVQGLKTPAPAPTPAAAPASSAPQTPAAPAQAAHNGDRETRQRMPRIRQVIASRLMEAQQTTAMLTTFNEVDMTAVMALRSQYKENFLDKHGVKLGFMSFFVKAVVSGLKAVPKINASIDGTEFVQRHYYDIGIAVSSDRGLVVPVVRDCDMLSFSQVEGSISNYARAAREGSLSMDDLSGGGFTITNGGTFGSLLSTPILNPPQSGILGMHKIQKRPMVVDDKIEIRPMMYLALSYDHRIVDGSEAVTFLVHVKDCIEDPSRMLLSV